MILWTIQDERTYDDFLARGFPYRVADEHTMPWTLSDDPATPDLDLFPYLWMAEQLTKKAGPAPDDVCFPVWAWKKGYGRADGKPDMRGWVTDEPQKVVRLKLEIPDERVLLSDFDAWHIPLNLGYFAKSETEDTEFYDWAASVAGREQLWVRDGIWDDDASDSEKSIRRRIEDSWVNCLELEPTPEKGFDPEWMGNWQEDTIQAVFWEIRPDDVVSVERFTTRKASKS